MNLADLDLEGPEAEGRRDPGAVDRGRREQHREGRSGADRRQPGRGAPDRLRTARRGRRVRRAVGRVVIAAGPPGSRRRHAVAAACALEGELDDPPADGDEVSPASAGIVGKRLIGVKPGIVLISER